MRVLHKRIVGTERSIKLAAATATVLGSLGLFSQSSLAQQRVGTDGRARDASNLVGSGGYNGTGSGAPLSLNLVNNSIVNGDITGGKAFRGNLAFEDPTAFHGDIAGQGLSNFIANSTGVTTSGVLTNNANQTRIYLGDGRGVNAPSNFVSLGTNGGYVQAPVLNSSPSDGRLGDPAALPSASETPQSIYAPAGTQAGGARSAYITASPLYGVKRLDAAQQSNGSTDFSQSSASLSSTALNSRLDDSAATRLQALNEGLNSDLTPGSIATPANSQFSPPNTIGQQQGLPSNGNANGAQLNAAAGNDQTGNNANNPNGNQTGNPTGNQSGNLSGNLAGNQAGNPNSKNSQGTAGSNNFNGNLDSGSAINGRTPNRSLNGAIPGGTAINANAGNQPLRNDIGVGQANKSTLVDLSRATSEQKSAYLQMIQRLQAQGGNSQLTVSQRNLLQQARKSGDLDKLNNKGDGADRNNPAKMDGGRNASGFGTVNVPAAGAAGAGAAGGGGGVPAMSPPSNGGAVMPGQVPVPKTQSNNIVVPSFAREETDKPTAALLGKAEELMKQGKFSSALEQYDQVEQISPNNPFALLGRANAELGATSYGLAEQHLRRAFTSDQALTMAHYDLSAFLGNDRLQYLIKDLKDIAQANPTEPRPVFLLAYICYNTNKDRAAAMYLNLAEKREGKPDSFYKLLQQRWDLPDVTNVDGAGEMNK